MTSRPYEPPHGPSPGSAEGRDGSGSNVDDHTPSDSAELSYRARPWDPQRHPRQTPSPPVEQAAGAASVSRGHEAMTTDTIPPPASPVPLLARQQQQQQRTHHDPLAVSESRRENATGPPSQSAVEGSACASSTKRPHSGYPSNVAQSPPPPPVAAAAAAVPFHHRSSSDSPTPSVQASSSMLRTRDTDADVHERGLQLNASRESSSVGFLPPSNTITVASAATAVGVSRGASGDGKTAYSSAGDGYTHCPSDVTIATRPSTVSSKLSPKPSPPPQLEHQQQQQQPVRWWESLRPDSARTNTRVGPSPATAASGSGDEPNVNSSGNNDRMITMDNYSAPRPRWSNSSILAARNSYSGAAPSSLHGGSVRSSASAPRSRYSASTTATMSALGGRSGTAIDTGTDDLIVVMETSEPVPRGAGRGTGIGGLGQGRAKWGSATPVGVLSQLGGVKRLFSREGNRSNNKSDDSISGAAGGGGSALFSGSKSASGIVREGGGRPLHGRTHSLHASPSLQSSLAPASLPVMSLTSMHVSTSKEVGGVPPMASLAMGTCSDSSNAYGGNATMASGAGSDGAAAMTSPAPLCRRNSSLHFSRGSCISPTGDGRAPYDHTDNGNAFSSDAPASMTGASPGHTAFVRRQQESEAWPFPLQLSDVPSPRSGAAAEAAPAKDEGDFSSIHDETDVDGEDKEDDEEKEDRDVRVPQHFRTRNANALYAMPWDQRVFVAAPNGIAHKVFSVIGSPRFWEKLDWAVRASWFTVLPTMILTLHERTQDLFPIPSAVANLAYWITMPTFGAGLRELFFAIKGFGMCMVLLIVTISIHPGVDMGVLIIFFFETLICAFIAEEAKSTATYVLCVYTMQYITDARGTGYTWAGKYMLTLLIALGFGLAAFFVPYVRWSSTICEHYLTVYGNSMACMARLTYGCFWVDSQSARELAAGRLHKHLATSEKCAEKIEKSLGEMEYEPHTGVYIARLHVRYAFVQSVRATLSAGMQAINHLVMHPELAATPTSAAFGRAIGPELSALVDALDEMVARLSNIHAGAEPHPIVLFFLRAADRDPSESPQTIAQAEFAARYAAFQRCVAAAHAQILVEFPDHMPDEADVLIGFFLFSLEQLANTIANFREEENPRSSILYRSLFLIRDVQSSFEAVVAVVRGVMRRRTIPRRLKEAIKMALCMFIAGVFQVYALKSSPTSAAAGAAVIGQLYSATGGESFQYATGRLMGTVLGSVISLMTVQVAQGRQGVLFAGVATLSFIGAFVQASPGFYEVGNTILGGIISVMTAYTDQTIAMVCIQQNVFASLIYFLVTFTVWPVRSRTQVRVAMDMSLRCFQQCLGRLLHNLDLPENADKVCEDIRLMLDEMELRIGHLQSNLGAALSEPTLTSTEFPEDAWVNVMRTLKQLHSTMRSMCLAYKTFTRGDSVHDAYDRVDGKDGGEGGLAGTPLTYAHWVVLHRMAPSSRRLGDLAGATVQLFLESLASATMVSTQRMTHLHNGMLEACSEMHHIFVTSIHPSGIPQAVALPRGAAATAVRGPPQAAAAGSGASVESLTSLPQLPPAGDATSATATSSSSSSSSASGGIGDTLAELGTAPPHTRPRKTEDGNIGGTDDAVHRSSASASKRNHHRDRRHWENRKEREGRAQHTGRFCTQEKEAGGHRRGRRGTSEPGDAAAAVETPSAPVPQPHFTYTMSDHEKALLKIMLENRNPPLVAPASITHRFTGMHRTDRASSNGGDREVCSTTADRLNAGGSAAVASFAPSQLSGSSALTAKTILRVAGLGRVAVTPIAGSVRAPAPASPTASAVGAAGDATAAEDNSSEGQKRPPQLQPVPLPKLLPGMSLPTRTRTLQWLSAGSVGGGCATKGGNVTDGLECTHREVNTDAPAAAVAVDGGGDGAYGDGAIPSSVRAHAPPTSPRAQHTLDAVSADRHRLAVAAMLAVPDVMNVARPRGGSQGFLPLRSSAMRSPHRLVVPSAATATRDNQVLPAIGNASVSPSAVTATTAHRRRNGADMPLPFSPARSSTAASVSSTLRSVPSKDSTKMVSGSNAAVDEKKNASHIIRNPTTADCTGVPPAQTSAGAAVSAPTDAHRQEESPPDAISPSARAELTAWASTARRKAAQPSTRDRKGPTGTAASAEAATDSGSFAGPPAAQRRAMLASTCKPPPANHTGPVTSSVAGAGSIGSGDTWSPTNQKARHPQRHQHAYHDHPDYQSLRGNGSISETDDSEASEDSVIDDGDDKGMNSRSCRTGGWRLELPPLAPRRWRRALKNLSSQAHAPPAQALHWPAGAVMARGGGEGVSSERPPLMSASSCAAPSPLAPRGPLVSGTTTPLTTQAPVKVTKPAPTTTPTATATTGAATSATVTGAPIRGATSTATTRASVKPPRTTATIATTAGGASTAHRDGSAACGMTAGNTLPEGGVRDVMTTASVIVSKPMAPYDSPVKPDGAVAAATAAAVAAAPHGVHEGAGLHTAEPMNDDSSSIFEERVIFPQPPDKSLPFALPTVRAQYPRSPTPSSVDGDHASETGNLSLNALLGAGVEVRLMVTPRDLHSVEAFLFGLQRLLVILNELRNAVMDMQYTSEMAKKL